MSDTPAGPGWWMADDGRWYAPELRRGDDTTPPTAAESVTEVDTPAVTPAPVAPGEPSTAGARRGVLIAAGVAAILVAAAVGYLLAGTGDDGDPIAADDTTTTSESTTTSQPGTTEPEPEPETTTTEAPPDRPAVLSEPAGLFCRDLIAKGYDYRDTVAYWEHHGRPANMDASGNGIPCQTVYPTAEVEAQWGTVPGGSVDTSSPLLRAFPQALSAADSMGLPDLQRDLATLTSRTNTTWTREMLLALGTSYCNDWPSEPGGEDFTVVSAAGKDQWAGAMAPVLGISVSDARAAIETDIWARYQFVCE